MQSPSQWLLFFIGCTQTAWSGIDNRVENENILSNTTYNNTWLSLYGKHIVRNLTLTGDTQLQMHVGNWVTGTTVEGNASINMNVSDYNGQGIAVIQNTTANSGKLI